MKEIKAIVRDLPAAQAEAFDELLDHVERVIRVAGDPVDKLVIAMIGIKMLDELKGVENGR